MKNNALLYGIVGFLLGGLLVSIAATTFDKPKNSSMDAMTTSLETKQGDAYDQAFLADMIAHHQAALDMAKLSASHAKHDDIKKLSDQIIHDQQQEITRMQQWQKAWGYDSSHMMDHM